MGISNRVFIGTARRWIAATFGVVCLCLSIGLAQARELAVHITGPSGQPLSFAAIQVDWNGDTPMAVPDAPLAMHQRDLRFVPHMMIVPAGAAVSFPNDDKTRHHVYSFSRAKRFDIKLYVGLPAHPVRFPTPGVVTLGCNIHDQMQAFLIVSDAARAAITDGNGVARFTGLPDKPLTLGVWHPWMASEETRVQRHITADQSVVDIQLANLIPPPPDDRDNTLQKRFNALAH